MSGQGGKRSGAGRPKGKVSEAKKQLADMLMEHVPAAIDTLAKAAANGDTNAATAILDRVYGKPRQAIEQSGGFHFKGLSHFYPQTKITKDMTPKEASAAYEATRKSGVIQEHN